MVSIKFILKSILPDSCKDYLDQRFPEWTSVVHKVDVRIKLWTRKLVHETIKFTLLATFVYLAYIAVLYVMRGSWFIFKDTVIGIRYVENVHPARAAEISRVLSFEFKRLGGTVIVLGVVVSSVIGIVSQLTMLRRFFYVGRSSLIKLVWMILVGTIVADRLAAIYQLQFYLAFSLGFLPTAILLNSILISVGKLIPELNILLLIRKYREQKAIRALKDDLAKLQDGRAGK